MDETKLVGGGGMHGVAEAKGVVLIKVLPLRSNDYSNNDTDDGGGTDMVIIGRKSAEDGNQPTSTPPKANEKKQSDWGHPCHRGGGDNADETVISRLDMYCTQVLMYYTMILLARPTKVRH